MLELDSFDDFIKLFNWLLLGGHLALAPLLRRDFLLDLAQIGLAALLGQKPATAFMQPAVLDDLFCGALTIEPLHLSELSLSARGCKDKVLHTKLCLPILR